VACRTDDYAIAGDTPPAALICVNAPVHWQYLPRLCSGAWVTMPGLPPAPH
jgi:hypothetical protein